MNEKFWASLLKIAFYCKSILQNLFTCTNLTAFEKKIKEAGNENCLIFLSDVVMYVVTHTLWPCYSGTCQKCFFQFPVSAVYEFFQRTF